MPGLGQDRKQVAAISSNARIHRRPTPTSGTATRSPDVHSRCQQTKPIPGTPALPPPRTRLSRTPCSVRRRLEQPLITATTEEGLRWSPTQC